MISYYIQPGHRCWLVMRDGRPAAKFTRAHLALDLARLLATKSAANGEKAVFTGIAKELLAPATRAA